MALIFTQLGLVLGYGTTTLCAGSNSFLMKKVAGLFPPNESEWGKTVPIFGLGTPEIS